MSYLVSFVLLIYNEINNMLKIVLKIWDNIHKLINAARDLVQ